MKILIDIPEEDYILAIKDDYRTIYGGTDSHIADAIKVGVILPKNHGRLIMLSEDKLKENLMNLDFSCQKWISEVGLS